MEESNCWWRKMFLDHPRSLGETYLEHLWKALQIAMYLLIFCLIPVTIHSIVPGLFRTTASTHVTELSEMLRKRKGLF